MFFNQWHLLMFYSIIQPSFQIRQTYLCDPPLPHRPLFLLIKKLIFQLSSFSYKWIVHMQLLQLSKQPKPQLEWYTISHRQNQVQVGESVFRIWSVECEKIVYSH